MPETETTLREQARHFGPLSLVVDPTLTVTLRDETRKRTAGYLPVATCAAVRTLHGKTMTAAAAHTLLRTVTPGGVDIRIVRGKLLPGGRPALWLWYHGPSSISVPLMRCVTPRD